MGFCRSLWCPLEANDRRSYFRSYRPRVLCAIRHGKDAGRRRRRRPCPGQNSTFPEKRVCTASDGRYYRIRNGKHAKVGVHKIVREAGKRPVPEIDLTSEFICQGLERVTKEDDSATATRTLLIPKLIINLNFYKNILDRKE